MECIDVAAMAITRIQIMKKVVVISNTTWNAWNYRQSLNKGLLAAGYKVSVFASKDGFEKNLKEKMGISTKGIYLSAKGLNPLLDVFSFLQIFILLLWTRPDVVLTFTIKPVIYGGLACRILGIPCVPTLTGLGTVFIRQNWVTSLVINLYRYSLKSSLKIIFQNKEDQNLFLNTGIVKEKQTYLVPGSGVNTDEFSIDRFPLREKSQNLTFLLVARMLKDKGILEYVKAAEVLKKKYPFCHFQLLGPSDVQNRTAISRQEILKWEEQGWIEYLGESLDVASFLSKSDVAVLPSYREGMPRSLLEAASMSLPLVATDVPGCRDLLINQNGFLCQPENPESLAKAMENMILSKEQQRLIMGRNSRQMILEKFSEKIIIEKYLEVLDTVKKN